VTHRLHEASWYFVYLCNARSAFTGHMPEAAPLERLRFLQIEARWET